MSVTAVVELQKELRRLAVAGSDVSAGDERLLRLLPGIREAGRTVPVFSRLAEVLQSLAEARSEAASPRLLEAAALVDAIAYTQGDTAACPEPLQMPVHGVDIVTNSPYSVVSPVMNALSSRKPGRLDVIVAAERDGRHVDFRLAEPFVRALDDQNPEIRREVAEHILPAYGKSIVPVLLSRFDKNGGKAHAIMLEHVLKYSGQEADSLCLEAATEGSSAVSEAALGHLRLMPGTEQLWIRLSRNRKREVRRIAYEKLLAYDSREVTACLAHGMLADHIEVSGEIFRAIGDHVPDELFDALDEAGWKYILRIVGPGSKKSVDTDREIYEMMRAAQLLENLDRIGFFDVPGRRQACGEEKVKEMNAITALVLEWFS